MKLAYNRVMQDVPGKYFPPRMLAWLGIQRFQKEDYETTIQVLDKIANREDPLETPVNVWRYLAKAGLQESKFENALEAVNQVIEREEEDFWKSDALLDKAHALIGLENYEEAIVVADQGLYHDPKGTIEAGLRLAIAESKYRNGDLNTAKDEFLLVASKFESDDNIHPYALWKTTQVLEAQDSPAADAMRNQLREQYPEWEAPAE